MRHIHTSIYIVIIIINTLQSNNLSRTTAHPHNCASSHPRNRATPAGPLEPPPPPSSLLRLRGTPYTTLLVFPARCYTLWLLSYPERAGIPISEEGANTPSRTLPFSYVICRTDPLLSYLCTTDHSYVFLCDPYTYSYAAKSHTRLYKLVKPL